MNFSANKIPENIKKSIPKQFLTAGKQLLEKKNIFHFDFVRNTYTANFSDERGSFWTTIKKRQDEKIFNRMCSCNTYLHHMNCQHIGALLIFTFSKSSGALKIEDTIHKHFEQSLWCNIAKIAFEYYGNDQLSIEVKKFSANGYRISGFDIDKNEIISFTIPQVFLTRIVQKYRWKFFENLKDTELPVENEKIKLEYPMAEKTDLEIRMNESGYKSWLQKFEDSYWFDFSKSWFVGFGDAEIEVDFSQPSKVLTLFISNENFKIHYPHKQVARILPQLVQNEKISQYLKIKSEIVSLNYSLEVTDEHDLEITPILILPNQNDPLFLNKKTQVKPVIFGKYLYLKNDGFYPFERKIQYFDSSLFGFDQVRIPNEKIYKFIVEYKKYIDEGQFYHVSPSLQQKDIQNQVKAVDVFIDKMEDDWLYLSLKYRVGDETISFYEIYKAIRDGKRFLIGKNIWIDLHQIDFKWILSFLNEQATNVEFIENSGVVDLKIKKMNFIKLNAHLPLKSKIKARRSLEIIIENLTHFKPLTPVPFLDNFKYKLREYQKHGFEWLWFLWENNLSGLLCDDMGLGKTYQSMALIDSLLQVNEKKKNFLIVCPTSVLPHWHDKLKQLNKKVNLLLYHGSDRDLKSLGKKKYTVILTSYGILRNDLEKLIPVIFEMAIFDEIQAAKNKASVTNAALNQLNSRMRLGLTGTPIENSLSELKALFDIVLPDYLGSDFSFRKHYTVPIERHQNNKQKEELRKAVQPFILRRTKVQVLHELPPKIEDVRKCALSTDQVKLYEQVLNGRAKSLVAQLYNHTETVPYIHIFAVLNHLKQICNHPAQLEDGVVDYNKYQSGKWDLFCELIEESLNSGFKIVVFSQYLNMLALIEQYLKDNKIEFATIKGSTQNRKEMIDRFNNDPECKVFTGSLRASGQGIDLIGGSVVIHYDRWWNAAVENQATDRVHRIGQTRGVQVFKIVTEGTLEEKIDRLIAKKKQLMDEMVQEDDANVVKQFSREDLIELLTLDKNK